MSDLVKAAAEYASAAEVHADGLLGDCGTEAAAQSVTALSLLSIAHSLLELARRPS